MYSRSRDATHSEGTGDRVPAALVVTHTRFTLEVNADTEDDAAIRPSLAQISRHALHLVGRERDRVPDPRERRAPQRRTRDAGDPELGAASPNEPRRHPAVEGQRAPLVADTPGHLLKDRPGELEPLVEKPASSLEPRAKRCELPLHPARCHRRNYPPAREEVECGELFQRDERIPLRNDQSGDAKLEPLRPGGEEAERDEGLGDRPVDARILVGNHQMVGHPRGVEPGGFRRDRDVSQLLGGKRGAVVREDHAQVERRHGRTLSGPSRARCAVLLVGGPITPTTRLRAARFDDRRCGQLGRQDPAGTGQPVQMRDPKGGTGVRTAWQVGIY